MNSGEMKQGLNRPSVVQEARRYLGDNGIGGDVINAYFHVIGELDSTDPKPARTYEDYIRNVKYAHRPDLADAIIQQCDKAKVAQFDALVASLNDVLKKEQSVANRSEAMKSILDELAEIV